MPPFQNFLAHFGHLRGLRIVFLAQTFPQFAQVQVFVSEADNNSALRRCSNGDDAIFGGGAISDQI